MAYPSLTYTLTNGTTADATKVMQDFNDLLNGITDGTKDININALTVAGAAAFNGNVTLGNASGDSVTVTGSLASNIVPTTTATYALGSSTYGWTALYLGNGSYRVGVLAPTLTATWDLTLPVAAGSANQVLKNTGSGSTKWDFPNYTGVLNISNTGDYTITDTDGYGVILVLASGQNHTITLPTLADNDGRKITIKRVDNNPTYYVKVDGEGTEQIEDRLSVIINSQYDYITLVADYSNLRWVITDKRLIDYVYNSNRDGTSEVGGTATVYCGVQSGVTVFTGYSGAQISKVLNLYSRDTFPVGYKYEFQFNVQSNGYDWVSLGDDNYFMKTFDNSGSPLLGVRLAPSNSPTTTLEVAFQSAPANTRSWTQLEDTHNLRWRVKVTR